MAMGRVPAVWHRYLEVDGVRVFYREAGPVGAPVLLLLHGFPSASHQFRRLIDALGDRYRLVAPDYPGFGNTETPDDFVFTFDRLAGIVEGFVQRLGLDRFVMYVFDFGAPVGFRIATRHPEWIEGLVVQNGNAYDDGLSEGARDFIALRPEDPGAQKTIRDLLTLTATRGQYEGGTGDPEQVAPDGWILDQRFLDLPGRHAAQVALAFDYKSNLALYPAWQQWLRAHTPPTLIVWGRNDPFFPEPGARAYLRDLPDAELHLFDTGHFALEENLPQIAELIAGFLRRLHPAAATTVELTRFRAQAGSLLRARPGMLEDFRADRDGFLGARLVRLSEDEWLDIVHWRSAEDRAASKAKGANRPGIAAFFAAIDELVAAEDGQES